LTRLAPQTFTRRNALGLGLAATLPVMIPIGGLTHAQTRPIKARIVIVGGGFGGATSAQTLKALAPGLAITLLEPKPDYWACPFSNLVLTGDRSMPAQRWGYDGLRARGIDVVPARAWDIDTTQRIVRTQDSTQFPYDVLILSPGITLRWNAVDGYDEAAAQALPHAWQAGDQTRLLARQISDMSDGGTVVISVPKAPYRCPPGPYERASLIAHYLKTQKPRSKLLILDSKETFSKQPLFEQAWAETYGDILDWRSGSNDGHVIRVDPATRSVFTDFETITADVANIIPPQKAGLIAERAGVADATGWCPVNAVDFTSALQPHIHVIGDASIAAPMPKSAFSAALQGKICAIQIVRALAGLTPEPSVLTNTCYSFISPDAAVSISGAYSNNGGTLTQIKGAGGLSPLQAQSASARQDIRQSEAQQAADWYRSVTYEAFG